MCTRDAWSSMGWALFLGLPLPFSFLQPVRGSLGSQRWFRNELTHTHTEGEIKAARQRERADRQREGGGERQRDPRIDHGGCAIKRQSTTLESFFSFDPDQKKAAQGAMHKYLLNFVCRCALDARCRVSLSFSHAYTHTHTQTHVCIIRMYIRMYVCMHVRIHV